MQSKLKILFIDDHNGLREGMIFLLKNKNPSFEISGVSNVEEGIEILSKDKDISLVILDLNLDGENSLEKIPAIKKANDADIAFSGYDRVDLDTGKTVSIEMTQYGTMNKEVDWNDDFIVYANPSLWNKLYRREIVKDLEFLPFRGCNDTLFLIHSYM